MENSDAEIYANYFFNYLPNHQVTHVPCYNSVVYKNIYNNIDLVVMNNSGNLKYKYIVYSGGNPNNIKFHFRNESNLSIDGNGNLNIGNNFGTIVDLAPIAFQNNNSVTCAYHLIGDSISFNLGNYNAADTLIIDPELRWGTFLSGVNIAVAYAIGYQKEAGTDFVYTVGENGNANFIAVPSTLTIHNYASPSYGYNADGFLLKIHDDGSIGADCYVLYFGSQGEDYPTALTFDNAGNPIVAGMSDYDLNPSYNFNFGTLTNHFQSDPSVLNCGIQYDYDAFIIRYQKDGTNVLSGTYFGDCEDNNINDVAIDPVTQNIFIVGFSVAGGGGSGLLNISGFQNVSASGTEGLIASFNLDCSTLNWSSYIGSELDDEVSSIVIKDNYCYVAGSTRENIMAVPLNGNGFQATISPSFSYDAYVAKIDEYGGADALNAITYFGCANSYEYGTGICLGHNNDLILCGYTNNTSGQILTTTGNVNFSSPANVYQPNNAGGDDGFITGLSDDLTVREYTSYFGGTGDDKLDKIVTACGISYLISGISASTGQYVEYNSCPQGGGYGLIGSFRSDGFTIDCNWSSLYGCSQTELLSVASNDNGKVYVCGTTTCGNSSAIFSQLTTAPPPLIYNPGPSVIGIFNEVPDAFTIASSIAPVLCSGVTTTLSGTVTFGAVSCTTDLFYWYFNNVLISTTPTTSITASLPGVYKAEFFTSCGPIYAVLDLTHATCDCTNLIPLTTVPNHVIQAGIYTYGLYSLPAYIAPSLSTYFILGNVTFQGVNLLCGEHVEIRVQPGGLLTIMSDATHPSILHGCNKMWEGITVKEGATLIIDGATFGVGDNIISDCEDAVYTNFLTANGGTGVSFNHAYFHNNHIGNLLEQFSSAGNFYPSDYVGCHYDAPGPYLQPWSTGNAILSTATIGISMALVAEVVWPGSNIGGYGIKVDASGADPNVFSDLAIGINAASSDVYCINNRFENISRAGISFFKSSDQPTLLLVKDSKFINNGIGINYLSNQNPDAGLINFPLPVGLLVEHNEFENDGNDIYCTQNKRYSLIIKNNSFKNYRNNSVLVKHYAPDKLYLEVSHSNLFHADDPYINTLGVALSMQSNPIGQLQAVVDFNTFEGDIKSIGGTYLAIGTEISHNIITVGTGGAALPASSIYSAGIWLNNGIKNKVFWNTITSAWGPNAVHHDYGTYFSGTQGNILANNKIYDADVSALYTGNCANSNFYCNEFKGYHGITSTPQGAGVWLQGVPNGNIGINNLNVNPGFNAFVISTDPSQPLIDDVQPAFNHWEQGNLNERFYGDNPSTANELWYFYSATGTDEDAFPSGITWGNIFLPHPWIPFNNQNQSCVFIAPLIANNGGGEGERNALFEPAKDNELSALDNNATALLNYHADMNAYKELNPDSSWLNLGVASDVSYQEYYDSLSTKNIGKLEQVNEHVLVNNAIEAEAINNSVIVKNAIEQTSKTVNTIYLNYIQMDSAYLTSTDSVTLNSIAHLNAYYYGPGVFTARALLNLFLPEPLIENEYRFESIENENKMQDFNWNIYPNPTNNFTYVVIPGNSNQLFELKVSDVLGRILFTVKGVGNKYLLQLDALTAGVYEITLIVENNNKGIKKVVIVK